jgi:uncharacterized surface protein with fasciclin (FAS1) repeats
MRTSSALTVVGLLTMLGTADLYGQQGQSQAGQNIDAKNFAPMIDPAAFKHVEAGPNIAAVLKANGQYSQFLRLVQKAGLLPVLDGTVKDTTYAMVTFREAVDSGHNPVYNSDDFQIPTDQLPSGVNTTDVKEQIANTLDSMYTEAKKYAFAQEGLLTVFAPPNAAFAAAPKGQLDQLMHDSTALATFVRAHIVTKGVYTHGLPMIKTLQSLAGSTLPVAPTGTGALSVGGVPIVGAEVVAGNGVVHRVQTVFPWPTAPSAP